VFALLVERLLVAVGTDERLEREFVCVELVGRADVELVRRIEDP